MTDIDLDALEATARAATGGPWHWAGNTDTGEPYLATWTKGYGRCQVLAIGYDERSTTGREADRVRADAREFDLGDPDELVDQWAHDGFGQPVREPRLEFVTDLMCVNARDLAVYEVAPNATSREDPDVYRADVAGIRHPDAKHIAAFDPTTALALIARLREAEAVIGAIDAIEPMWPRGMYGAPQDMIGRNQIRAILSRYKTTKTEGTDRENGSRSDG